MPKMVEAEAVQTRAAPASKPSESELVQIETAREKLAAVVEVVEARPQPVIRRRARQLEVYVENEPLQQIETQHSK